MKIVLLGKTGDGKSSSGNTILGNSTGEQFVTNSSPNSVTSKCEVLTGLRAGKETQIKIIDTPGFFDTRMSDEELKPEIVKCIALNSPGPHAFIIVLTVGTFTEQETATVEHITRSFGEHAFKYSAVLFTHGNDLDEGQTIEQFVDQSKELKELVKKCGGGCHVIDNKHWNQEHEYRSNSVQVEKLLNTIEEMVRKNGGGCYTNEMLKLAEKEIQREEEEIIKENPNEKSAFKIRAEAIGRFIKKVLVKCAGLAVGAFIGALLGMVAATSAVAFLIQTVGPVSSHVTGGIFAVGATAGGIGGGIVGVQEVVDGDTTCEAVKKAARATYDTSEFLFTEVGERVKEWTQSTNKSKA